MMVRPLFSLFSFATSGTNKGLPLALCNARVLGGSPSGLPAVEALRQMLQPYRTANNEGLALIP